MGSCNLHQEGHSTEVITLLGLLVHLVCNLDGPREDLLDVVQPVGRLQVAQPAVVLDVGETHVLHLEQSKGEDYQNKIGSTVTDLAETLPHDVYVVDVEEDELRVLVVVLALVPAALRHVRHRVHFRPGVVNVDPGDKQSEY